MSVLSFLSETADRAVLSEYELTSINTSVSTLQTRLGAYFPRGAIKEHFRFGSSTRKTILPRSMDEQSDIDYMIVFNDKDVTPQAFLDRLRRFVEYYYKNSEIHQSSPTIVLELNHIKFDLVPAKTNWIGTLQIPNGSGGWIDTDPNDFNTQLENKNKNNGWLVKPTIRLVKYWNAASGYPFESFELEKWICGIDFSVFFWQTTIKNQKDFFIHVIEKMSASWNAPQKIKYEVQRAKDLIAEVKQRERNGMPQTAEEKIRRLFRLQKNSL